MATRRNTVGAGRKRSTSEIGALLAAEQLAERFTEAMAYADRPMEIFPEHRRGEICPLTRYGAVGPRCGNTRKEAVEAYQKKPA